MNLYPHFLLMSFCIFLIPAILANTDHGTYLSAKCRRKYRHLLDRLPSIKSINYPVVVNVASITIEGAVRPCTIAVLPNSLQITDSKTAKVLVFLPMSTIRGVA
jgi:membrane-bound ClpP family serine protease